MTKQLDLKKAIKKNDIEAVILLLSNADLNPSYNDNEGIKIAAQYGYTEIVKLLLEDKRITNLDKNSSGDPIGFACLHGHLEVVKLLINDPRNNPNNDNNIALHAAIDRGFSDIVELLLKDKRVDPSCMKNWAIININKKLPHRITELIWGDYRVKKSLKKDDIELYNKLIMGDKLNKF
jgi:ankyrin repeat protein